MFVVQFFHVAGLSCAPNSACIISSTEDVSGTLRFASLFVQSSGKLRCVDSQSNEASCDLSIVSTGSVIIEGDVSAANLAVNASSLSVLGSGRLHADGLGYQASQGPGAGTNATQRSCKLSMGGAGECCVRTDVTRLSLSPRWRPWRYGRNGMLSVGRRRL